MVFVITILVVCLSVSIYLFMTGRITNPEPTNKKVFYVASTLALAISLATAILYEKP